MEAAPDCSFHRLDRDPAARRVRKKALPVRVRFAAAAGLVQTLEGPIHHGAGAALCTGPLGESWPLARAGFERRYAPAAGQAMGEDGAYLPLPRPAWARQMPQAFLTRTGIDGQPLHGKPGDWLVLLDEGHCGVVADAVFRATYEPA